VLGSRLGKAPRPSVRCEGRSRQRRCKRRVHFDPTRLGQYVAIRCNDCRRVFCSPCARKHFGLSQSANALDRAVHVVAQMQRTAAEKLRRLRGAHAPAWLAALFLSDEKIDALDRRLADWIQRTTRSRGRDG
jgi:hypothetical protein